VPAPQLELDWPAYADELGRRVATARRSQGVSQTELAASTGLSRTQIQNIERSRTYGDQRAGNTTLLSIFKIAQALGIPPRYLIPDGVPQPDYRAKLDETWSAIEFDISSDISKHPLPPTTKASQFVKPLVDPKTWIPELNPQRISEPVGTKPGVSKAARPLLRPPVPKPPRMVRH
jgi:transcriptional regulator with XRE-family HTH domain